MKITVTSKYDGILSVKEASTGIRHTWPKAGDIVFLTEENILNIISTPGGRYILENNLTYDNDAVYEMLGIQPEPEDKMSAEQIKALLKGGTLEQLEDALNFANEGTIELIESLAITEQVSDMNKLELISRKTGADMLKKVELYKKDFLTKEEEKSVAPTGRKAAVFNGENAEEPATPVRKYQPVK